MMRVLILLMVLSFTAWAGDKKKNETGKPKSSSIAEHHMTKAEVASEFGATFVKDDVVSLSVNNVTILTPAWRFDMKGRFPCGVLPFFVPPDPTKNEAAAAFVSSLGTVEAYASIIKDSQKKSESAVTPGI